MSDSMAAIIAAHCETDELRCHAPGCGHTYPPFEHYEGDGAVDDRVQLVSEHIAAKLAEAGFGPIRAACAAGWDVAVKQLVYEDGASVEVVENDNPFRKHRIVP